MIFHKQDCIHSFLGTKGTLGALKQFKSKLQTLGKEELQNMIYLKTGQYKRSSMVRMQTEVTFELTRLRRKQTSKQIQALLQLINPPKIIMHKSNSFG